MSAKGTQESPEQVEAERQQSEWTGHWRCLYHQAATSLLEPLTIQGPTTGFGP